MRDDQDTAKSIFAVCLEFGMYYENLIPAGSGERHLLQLDLDLDLLEQRRELAVSVISTPFNITVTNNHQGV